MSPPLVRPALILPTDLTPAIRAVLGLPNFRTGPIAHLFRAAGHDIKPRLEDEQAFVLHRFLVLALEHGDDWHSHSVRDVDAALDIAKALATRPKT